MTPTIDGFCRDDEKELGPVHEYVAPATAGVDKFKVAPVQTGELLEAVGVDGIGLTTTAVVATELVQPLATVTTEYVPAITAVAPGMDGFCVVEVKLFGPVHE